MVNSETIAYSINMYKYLTKIYLFSKNTYKWVAHFEGICLWVYVGPYRSIQWPRPLSNITVRLSALYLLTNNIEILKEAGLGWYSSTDQGTLNWKQYCLLFQSWRASSEMRKNIAVHGFKSLHIIVHFPANAQRTRNWLWFKDISE